MFENQQDDFNSPNKVVDKWEKRCPSLAKHDFANNPEMSDADL